MRPLQRRPHAPRGGARSPGRRRRYLEMHWMSAMALLREHRMPGVLVTMIAVRGHAPREAGAKMVVSARDCWGSIGGGNLEQSALLAARELLTAGTREPETRTWGLTERAPARHDIELHLVDSRAQHVEPERLAALTADAEARVHTHHAVVPELVLGELPAGCHVLLMTHDHAEDVALCDAALRCGHLGSIGLIGSSVKWRRFAKRLAEEGHDEAALARITTPIGLPEITGKEPATIAVSVAADLLLRFQRERPASTQVRAESAEVTR